MDRIQADYDQLDVLARRFDQQTTETQRLIQRVRQSVDNLQRGGWIGTGANAFLSEMDDEIFPALTRLEEALEYAQETTQHISQTLRQAEEEAANVFSQGGGAAGGVAGGAAGGAAGEMGDVVLPPGFDWKGLGDNVLSKSFGVTSEVYEQLKKANPDWLKNVKGLDKFLDNKAITKGIPLIGSILLDEDLSTNWERAILPEVLTFGTQEVVQWGSVAVAGALLGPVAATVVGVGFIAYEGLLLAGHVTAGGFAWTGDTETANSIENWVNQHEWGEYLENRYEQGYDWVDQQVTTRLQEAEEALNYYGSGLVEGEAVVGKPFHNVFSLN
ncbi:MAG: WXG100 family type VII secretion target [Anaerolineales bacterium]|nr:WXG100 family type VII secretion target [Anaerolineales bacterium]